MRHTVSDGSGRYDPLDIASLQLWQQGQQEDNRQQDRKSTRLNSSHNNQSRMPSSA